MIETAPSALPAQEDYRKYDRIWQRVSPSLTPYPAVRAAPDAPETPCAADSEAAELLRGFLRDALADAQLSRCLAAAAPTREGCRLFRRLADEEAVQARWLQAAYYLVTGETYGVTVVVPPQPKLPWRDRLRGRYHELSCAAARYAHAAERTGDAGLARLFRRLSDEAYRRAEQLSEYLSRILCVGSETAGF